MHTYSSATYTDFDLTCNSYYSGAYLMVILYFSYGFLPWFTGILLKEDWSPLSHLLIDSVILFILV